MSRSPGDWLLSMAFKSSRLLSLVREELVTKFGSLTNVGGPFQPFPKARSSWRGMACVGGGRWRPSG